MRYLTFALTKGRLAKKTLEMLERLGITCEEMKDKDSRKLIFVNEELGLKFFLAKGPDVPTYVEYGAADIGIVGKDTILEEGRKLFDGKVVLGGFPNSQGSLIETGSKEELEKFTEQILTGAGTIGTVIGADCTIPSHLNLERLEWIRQRAASF